jgi:hypothetical protein
MSLLDELRDMVKGGAKVASVVEETVQAAAPEPVAAPAVAEQKQATSEPVLLSEDRMAEIRAQESKVVPIVEAPAVVVQMETVPAVPAESLDESLDEFGEEIERPVSETEEADETIHVHSRARIAFLLRTYEKNRPELTQKRIAVDKARHSHAHPQDFSQKPQPETVRGNPQLYLRSE